MKTNSPLKIILEWINLSRDLDTGEIHSTIIEKLYEEDTFEFVLSTLPNKNTETYSKSFSLLDKKEKELLVGEYLNKYENTTKIG